jgi:hypothetical protein
MEEIVDIEHFERYAVIYRDDERRAIILAAKIFREITLSDDSNYDNLETLQTIVEVSMAIEDNVADRAIFHPDLDAYIREEYLPLLIRAADYATPSLRAWACDKFDATPDELYTCASTAMQMLREEFPDIRIERPEDPGNGGILVEV